MTLGSSSTLISDVTYTYCFPVFDVCFLSYNCCLCCLLQACKLKLGDLKGALLDSDFAIRDGEDNVKAFFRQGQVSTYYLYDIQSQVY